jgi:two-component system chemotaxis sensor kinase CheA
MTFWMLLLLGMGCLTILFTTTSQIKENHIALTKQQLYFFNNALFNELRIKMGENDIDGLNDVIKKGKTSKNIADIKIFKSQKLIQFQKSNEKLTQEKDALVVFASKLPLAKEMQIDKKNYIKLLTPIIATNECLQCHTNQDVGSVIAVMETLFSMESYEKNANDIIWNIIYTSLFFGILTIIVLLIIIKRATEPIQGLKHGFKRLLNSNVYGSNVKLEIRTNDEIGDVALLFNEYIDKLTLEFKKSTDKFAQSIMDTQSDLVVTFDENRNITNVNQAFLTFFGVKDLDEFITQYDKNLSFVFKNTDSNDFISESVDGVFWEVYLQNNKNKMHKVILQNKEQEVVFTVSANSILFDDKVFTTSVFTNIHELETIREKMEENHTQFKILFDNANEGFLYFDRDMVIGSEYSSKAKEIFGMEIGQKYITNLLFEDEEEKVFVKDALVGILSETLERQEILISLLKDEFSINGRFIKVQYKVIGQDIFMLILSDITQNKYLNDKIKDEQQMYKMVITVIAFFELFTEVKDDYKRFTNEIEKYKTLEMLPTLRREIHTFKGLFAQLELLHIVKKLHSLETTIDYSLKIKEIDDDILYLSSKILYSWLEVDMDVIHKVFKPTTLTKSNVLKIEKERIENIYNNIEKYENTETLKIDIQKLTYNNIKDAFYAYGQLVRTLSKRLEKPMHELILDCGDIYLSDKYKPFLNTFVHMFRNSLDHGIETEEERYVFEKDLKGTITCTIKVVEGSLEILYTDDGRGINLNKLKSKILEKNLSTQEKLESLSEEAILMFIFQDGLSTKDIVTEISGRGVGLASLKEEIDRLDGVIKITNHPNDGVEFLFTLPIVD